MSDKNVTRTVEEREEALEARLARIREMEAEILKKEKEIIRDRGHYAVVGRNCIGRSSAFHPFFGDAELQQLASGDVPCEKFHCFDGRGFVLRSDSDDGTANRGYILE